MRATVSVILMLAVIFLLASGDQPLLWAQENQPKGEVIESQQPRTPPRRSRVADEEETGGYKPVGGANVYSYMLFILLGLIAVFLAFRGTKKG